MSVALHLNVECALEGCHHLVDGLVVDERDVESAGGEAAVGYMYAHVVAALDDGAQLAERNVVAVDVALLPSAACLADLRALHLAGQTVECGTLAGLKHVAGVAVSDGYAAFEERCGDVVVGGVCRNVESGAPHFYVISVGVYREAGTVATGNVKVAFALQLYTAFISAETAVLATR